MKNSEYWKERFRELEDEQYQKSVEYFNDVKEQFEETAVSIQMEIERWYQRLAENNDISYAEAKKLLKDRELEEFKRTVKQYIKAGEENAIDGRWLKELENASARYHIDRLEVMKLQIQQYAELLFQEFEKGITEYLRQDYAEQFYRTAFEVAKGTSVGVSLERLDTARIDKLIKRPWAQDGKNFSDRIWTNKEKLVRNLHTELSNCIIRGEAPAKAINRLAKKMDVSRSQAGRLIMTETSAIAAAAQKDCFEELGVEKYEFVATLDGKTCEQCGSMDGKVFRMDEYEPGLTANPLHPNCRCCTAPFYDDWEEFGINVRRAARDPVTGKTVHIDENISYQEWKEKYVYDKMEETTDKWSQEARDELFADERTLAERKIETAVVYSPEGKFLFQKRGTASEISFSRAECGKLKGTIISHNHPTGGSFSAQDILFLKNSKAAELRVITERCVFYMRRPVKWDKRINTLQKIKYERDNIKAEICDKYQKMYLEGKISKVQRYQLMSEEMNTKFAERFGIEYGKETIES